MSFQERFSKTQELCQTSAIILDVPTQKYTLLLLELRSIQVSGRKSLTVFACSFSPQSQMFPDFKYQPSILSIVCEYRDVNIIDMDILEITHLLF